MYAMRCSRTQHIIDILHTFQQSLEMLFNVCSKLTDTLLLYVHCTHYTLLLRYFIQHNNSATSALRSEPAIAPVSVESVTAESETAIDESATDGVSQSFSNSMASSTTTSNSKKDSRWTTSSVTKVCVQRLKPNGCI
jgi:hypothetical protein